MNESKLWQLRAGLITEGEYQESLEGVLETVAPKTTKATDLQFVLRDLGDAYGQGIADDQITPDFEKYTVGQIKQDWINLKKGVKEGNYSNSMEELNPPTAPPPAQGATQKEKLATSAPQLGTDLVKTGQDLKKSSNGLQSSEISRLDSVVAKLVDAAREKNFAPTLSQIEAFIDSKLKTFK